MTAPSTPSVTRSTFGTSTTDHNVSMPASTASGRLLVAGITTFSQTPATPTGWTQYGSTANTFIRQTYFAKIADGTEGGATVNFTTSAGDQMIAHVHYFSDASYTLADCIVFGTAATGSSSAPDSPSKTTGWGSADIYTISAASAYSADGPSAAPSGYSGGAFDITGAVLSMGTAYKSSTASSENPGAFSGGTVYYWVAQTICVRLNPSPAAPSAPTISSVSPSTFAFGEEGIVITGADFEASKGTGKVELSDNATYASGTKVTQSTASWSATSITMTAVQGSFSAGTFYVWVTNNTGDRNSTGYSVTLTEDAPPTPPPPPGAGILKGELQVQIYGSPPVGMIDDILEGARIEEGVMKLPSASFSASLNSVGVDLAVDGAEIGIRRVGVGEIFRGFITKRTEVTDSAGATIVHFQAIDLGLELINRQTWRSVLSLDETVASAQTAILSGSGWAPKLTGSGYLTITKEWINTNLLNAWAELASAANGYWRRTQTNREIEIINTNPSTGIILADTEGDMTSARFGIIESIDRVEYDYGAIVNRVGCEIKTDSARLVTLQEATRSSPRTISSVVRRPPRVASHNVTEVFTTAFSTVFNMLGENRYALALLLADSLADTTIATIGGQFMTNLGITNSVSTIETAVWGGIAPPKGTPQIDFKATVSSVTVAALVGLENVDQIDPVIEADKADGSGTSVSITVDSETDSIVVCFVVLPNLGSSTITPTNGAVLVGEITPVTVTDKDQLTVWTKPGGASTTSFTFTISPSQTWGAYAVSLRPAKVHYIEDSTSITAYGVREQNLALGSFGQLEESNENLANTAYDYLVDYLANRKDPPVFYGVSVSYLPSSPLEWLPGDTMQLKHRGRGIDEELIVVNRTQTFGEGGTVHWDLELSDRAMFRRDERGEWLLAQLMAGISSAQANQV